MPITQPKQIRYKQFLEVFDEKNKLAEDTDKSSDISSEYESEKKILEDTQKDDDDEEDDEDDDENKDSADISSSSATDESDSDYNKFLKDSESLAADETKDESKSSKYSRYNSSVKLNINRLLDLNDLSVNPIFTTEETYCLQFINVPSPMIDSLLLQKLTHLDNDLAEKLIYECLLNMEKISYSDDELDEESLKKNLSLRKSIALCEDEEHREVLVLEIYNILHSRLFNDKHRSIRMFMHAINQLNEKSKFSISYNEILLMLNKKPKKKINNVVNVNKKLVKITKREGKPKIIKKEQKVKKKIGEKEENPPIEMVTKSTDDTEDEEEKSLIYNMNTKGDGDNIKIDSDEDEINKLQLDENYKEDCTKMIREFKEFLAEHCHAGVQSLGKVITSHISDTISKIKHQKVKEKKEKTA